MRVTVCRCSVALHSSPSLFTMCDQETNIKFVQEVEKHEILYNYTLPGYSRKDSTQKAWQEVAANVNMSVAECKKRWRNLRIVFMRNMKPLPSGSSARKRTYYMADTLQFCLPFMKMSTPPENLAAHELEYDVESLIEIEDTTNESPIIEDLLASPKQPQSIPTEIKVEQDMTPQLTPKLSSNKFQQKRKAPEDMDRCSSEYFNSKNIRMESTGRENEREYLKMFLLSLLPELEGLNQSQIRLFKRRVLSLIDDISTS